MRVELLHAKGFKLTGVRAVSEMLEIPAVVGAAELDRGRGKDQWGNAYGWAIAVAKDENIVFIWFTGDPVASKDGRPRMPFARVRLLKDGVSETTIYEVK